MTKNILLAATAASVMAFAGAASAHTLTFRADAGAVGPDIASSIDLGETGGATSPYKLAAEAKAITPAFQQFDLVNTLSSGNLPSGNVVLTVTLNNGTFSSGLTAANVTAGGPTCSTFTAVPSLGGATGSTTATFVISNSAADCASFNLNLPIAPGATGPVTVQTRLTTEFGVAIDGLDSPAFTILTRPSAFGVTVDATFGAAGALDNTFATLLQTPVYTQFRNGGTGHANATENTTLGQLGTIRINVDTTAYRDLNSNAVAAIDVQSATVAATGSFTAFDGAGGDVTLGTASAKTAPNTLTTTAATFTGTQFGGGGANDLTSAARPFRVQRETTAVAIPSSTYPVTISYVLDATYYNQDPVASSLLEPIERDGTNVIFPWMNSNTIQTANGTTNLIRLGNISGAPTGPVFAQVLNTVPGLQGSGYVAKTAPEELYPNIAANGERVINTDLLTTKLGDFGRGDIQISVEAPSNVITARRFATLANGSVTEFESGTVANDQNAAVP